LFKENRETIAKQVTTRSNRLCFSLCNSLSSISFERDSELTGIKARAFAATHLSFVVVLVGVSFIAGDAFPTQCIVALASGDPNTAFGDWGGHHESGSKEAYERMT
jgi:hypothetical protein